MGLWNILGKNKMPHNVALLTAYRDFYYAFRQRLDRYISITGVKCHTEETIMLCAFLTAEGYKAVITCIRKRSYDDEILEEYFQSILGLLMACTEQGYQQVYSLLREREKEYLELFYQAGNTFDFNDLFQVYLLNYHGYYIEGPRQFLDLFNDIVCTQSKANLEKFKNCMK
jgi:hypothetical protein